MNTPDRSRLPRLFGGPEATGGGNFCPSHIAYAVHGLSRFIYGTLLKSTQAPCTLALQHAIPLKAVQL
jgi:hypothetical protein